MVHLVLSILLALMPEANPEHDFHVSIGRMAVENNQVLLQIRLFEDDLELGLQGFHSDDSLRLQVDSDTDSLFAAYLNDKLVITHGDEVLTGNVATSGEDVLYGYPVWWFSLMYEAPSAIEALHIDNRVLMEVFEDQQNVIRITHYPSENEKMYYMVDGNSDISVKF